MKSRISDLQDQTQRVECFQSDDFHLSLSKNSPSSIFDNSSPKLTSTYIAQKLAYAGISTWLDVLIEKCHSFYFWMSCSVMGIISIIVVVQDVLRILEHSEVMVVGGGDAQMYCACSRSFSQDFNRTFHIGCVIENIPKDIGPWIAESCHFNWVFSWQPDFLSNCHFLRHSCQNSHKSHIPDINMLLSTFHRGVIDGQKWKFVDRVCSIPVKCPHVKSMVWGWGSVPDPCHCASGFHEFRENVQSCNGFGSVASSISHSSNFFEISFISIFFCYQHIQIQNGVEAKWNTLAHKFSNERG